MPKVCTGCGHTLCMSCIGQQLDRSSNPECPFCRSDWASFKNQDCRFPTNVDILGVIEKKCLFHDEVMTLFCVKCKLRVCTSCIYIQQNHKSHKVVHVDSISNAVADAKQTLWKALDECEDYRKGIVQLIDESKGWSTKYIQARFNKPLSPILQMRRNQIIQGARLFFEEEEENAKEVSIYDDTIRQKIQEMIACLDNPSIDQATLQALSESEETIQFVTMRYYDLLIQKISDFKIRLTNIFRYPEFEINHKYHHHATEFEIISK